MGWKVLLCTRNLKFMLPRKLQEGYVGPFEVLKLGEPSVYKLDLSLSAALKIIHPIFHVSLLRDFKDNGLIKQPATSNRG